MTQNMLQASDFSNTYELTFSRRLRSNGSASGSSCKQTTDESIRKSSGYLIYIALLIAVYHREARLGGPL